MRRAACRRFPTAYSARIEARPNFVNETTSIIKLSHSSATRIMPCRLRDDFHRILRNIQYDNSSRQFDTVRWTRSSTMRFATRPDDALVCCFCCCHARIKMLAIRVGQPTAANRARPAWPRRTLFTPLHLTTIHYLSAPAPHLLSGAVVDVIGLRCVPSSLAGLDTVIRAALMTAHRKASFSFPAAWLQLNRN